MKLQQNYYIELNTSYRNILRKIKKKESLAYHQFLPERDYGYMLSLVRLSSVWRL